MAPILVVVVAVAGGVWHSRRSTQPPPSAPVTMVDGRDAAATITVHVAGGVAQPGLVVVAAEARVADVVAAAGGALPGARLSSLNLAAPVKDGEQIVVPIEGSGPDATAPVADGRVRVNVAGVDDLEALPGVGPVLAARIAAFRDANGPFRTIEDLLDVPGIGEGKLAAMRDAVAIP